MEVDDRDGVRELLRPGGTLVVVGLAHETTPAEWAATIAVAPIVRIAKVLRRASGPEACWWPTRGAGAIRGTAAAARNALSPTRAPPLLPDLA
ncbi:hypothetical protein ACFHYQ_15620 [Sphaerimonospora cavernae]|uniref:Alcohol dehydrogenase-like C-terminal domain-containing protein n=1 Tax=Sphaerimonospora cavernae TaxID=1740611 RepID=A0ABV6U5N8_9ACTN